MNDPIAIMGNNSPFTNVPDARLRILMKRMFDVLILKELTVTFLNAKCWSKKIAITQ